MMNRKGIYNICLFLFTYCLSISSVAAKIKTLKKTEKNNEAKQEEIPGEVHLTTEEEKLFDIKYKDLYGYHNTVYITPFDIKYDLLKFNYIDYQNVTYFDYYTYKQFYRHKIQDLGNDGTAAKMLYTKLDTYIGRTTGYNSYDLYIQNPLYRQYYNSHGPYTYCNVVFANLGSFIFDFTHSHSFNKNWHIGLSIDSMLIDSEIPNKEFPRNVVSYPLSIFGHYENDSESYMAFLSYYRKKHKIYENGGISVSYAQYKDDTKESQKNRKTSKWLKYINNENISPIDEVSTSLLLHECFFYHQFKINQYINIYHESIWKRQNNYFRINKSPNLTNDNQKSIKTYEYLTGYRFEKNRTNINDIYPFKDEDIVNQFSNELGIKGQVYKFFYQIHYRNNLLKRNIISCQNKHAVHLLKDKKFKEHYFGTYLRFDINKNHGVIASGEYLYDQKIKDQKQYNSFMVQTGYVGNYGELLYTCVSKVPSLLNQEYDDTYKFRQWKNDFHNVLNQNINLKGDFTIWIFNIQPYLSFNIIKDEIYYKKKFYNQLIHCNIEPYQRNMSYSYYSTGGLIGICLFDHYHLETDIIKTVFNKVKLDNIPSLYANIRIYYSDIFYKDRGSLNGGIEVNWHSPYYGDAYDPKTQQFYQQKEFLLYSFPIVDVFINFRISRFKCFFKVINILCNVLKEKYPRNYYASPYYKGQNIMLDFGCAWSLFD